MEVPDDVPSRILASLAALPEFQQAEVMRDAISSAIKQMSVYRILELRQQVQARFDCENPTVRATLELIDGQVALREISGGAGWR